MKNYKGFRWIFIAAAVLLSHIMCIDVAYHYCSLQWGGKQEGWSAPASTAFWGMIPYLIGITVCVVLAWISGKKGRYAE